MHSTDVLVLGAGIGAYQAAIAAAKTGVKVKIVGHAKGASPYILGFNAPLDVRGGDSPEKYFADTLEGGYHLGNRALIARLSREAEDAFCELQEWGVPFETRGGRPALRHLSGSRFPRSVFVKEGTGTAIHRALQRQADALGVERHLGLKIVRLVESQGSVIGALAKNQEGQLSGFRAGSTILALGGIGGLYDDSTYPTDVVGDSYALALDVGATLVDMEFVQFEPTVVTHPGAVKGMEMPTAMFGDGAIMLNAIGERFMCRYNPESCEKQIEKAKIALMIQTEIDEGRGTADGSVWFDATKLDSDCLKGYVAHYRRLVAAGVDPAREPVQIKPAAHSLMGGVKIDERCFSGVAGLFVCGEAAGGLHGASRIAGNGASDAIVLSRVAGRSAAQAQCACSQERFEQAMMAGIKRSVISDESLASEYLGSIRNTMSAFVGIRRSRSGLLQAMECLDHIRLKIAQHWDGSVLNVLNSVRNAAMVASAIAQSAQLREESRGAHFRRDFPDVDRSWQHSIEINFGPGGLLRASKGPLNSEIRNEKITA
jgi:aspartate oxidase